MSHLKKKILNLLKIDSDLKNKKNLCISNIKGFSNSKINNRQIRPYNDYNDYNDFENNKNLNNISSIPVLDKNNYNENLIVRKQKLFKNLNLTLFNTNTNNSQLFMPKNGILSSLNSNKNKKNINDIPINNNSNIRIIYNNFKDNKIYININKNKETLNEMSTIFNNKQIKYYKNIKNKNLIFKKNIHQLNEINEINSRKPILNNSKINKIYSYSKISNKNLENSRVSNKIKETIFQMEKEFSSSEVKKLLINRPMRTLNSKLFQFDSKEFKNFSPTLHVLNNSRIKQNNKNNNIYKLFSERYKNNIKKLFNKNCISLNNIYENKNKRSSVLNEEFNMNNINDKSSHKSDDNYYPQIKLKTNQKNKELYKLIIKNKKWYKIPVINREYQECSKNIRNDIRLKYSKNNLLTSFNNNPEYSNKVSQISYEC